MEDHLLNTNEADYSKRNSREGHHKDDQEHKEIHPVTQESELNNNSLIENNLQKQENPKKPSDSLNQQSQHDANSKTLRIKFMSEESTMETLNVFSKNLSSNLSSGQKMNNVTQIRQLGRTPVSYAQIPAVGRGFANAAGNFLDRNSSQDVSLNNMELRQGSQVNDPHNQTLFIVKQASNSSESQYKSSEVKQNQTILRKSHSSSPEEEKTFDYNQAQQAPIWSTTQPFRGTYHYNGSPNEGVTNLVERSRPSPQEIHNLNSSVKVKLKPFIRSQSQKYSASYGGVKKSKLQVGLGEMFSLQLPENSPSPQQPLTQAQDIQTLSNDGSEFLTVNNSLNNQTGNTSQEVNFISSNLSDMPTETSQFHTEEIIRNSIHSDSTYSQAQHSPLGLNRLEEEIAESLSDSDSDMDDILFGQGDSEASTQIPRENTPSVSQSQELQNSQLQDLRLRADNINDHLPIRTDFRCYSTIQQVMSTPNHDSTIVFGHPITMEEQLLDHNGFESLNELNESNLNVVFASEDNGVIMDIPNMALNYGETQRGSAQFDQNLLDVREDHTWSLLDNTNLLDRERQIQQEGINLGQRNFGLNTHCSRVYLEEDFGPEESSEEE